MPMKLVSSYHKVVFKHKNLWMVSTPNQCRILVMQTDMHSYSLISCGRRDLNQGHSEKLCMDKSSSEYRMTNFCMAIYAKVAIT